MHSPLIKWILGGIIAIVVLSAVYDFSATYFAYAFPQWLAPWMFLLFVAIYAFNVASQPSAGTAFTGAVRAAITTVKWAWPLFAAPLATLAIMITPVMNFAPETWEVDFARALSPILIAIIAWGYWQFSRLQEFSRDVGAWVALIVAAVVIIQSLFSGSKTIIAVALFSSSFAFYMARYVMGITSESKAFKTFGLIAKALFLASLFYAVYGYFVDSKKEAKDAVIEQAKEKLDEKKQQLKEKLSSAKEKLLTDKQYGEAIAAGSPQAQLIYKSFVDEKSAYYDQNVINTMFEYVQAIPATESGRFSLIDEEAYSLIPADFTSNFISPIVNRKGLTDGVRFLSAQPFVDGFCTLTAGHLTQRDMRLFNASQYLFNGGDQDVYE